MGRAIGRRAEVGRHGRLPCVVAASESVGDRAEDEPEEAADDQEAEDPVDEQASSLAKDRVDLHDRPCARSQSVTGLDLGQSDPGQKEEDARARAEQRPKTAQTKERRHPQGDRRVEADGRAAARRRRRGRRRGQFLARGSVLAEREVPDASDASQDDGCGAPEAHPASIAVDRAQIRALPASGARSDNVSPEAAVDAYLTHLKSERRSPENTLLAYEADLAGLLAFLADGGRQVPSDVRAIDVYALRGWLGHLARTLSASSIARKIAAVRSWMRWLRKRGVLQASPAELLSTPKVRPPLPTFLSVDHARQVVETPDDTTVGKRDRAILELLYGCGLRVSELTGLDLARVDLAGACVRVVGKGNKERLVPMGRPCVAAVRAYLAVRGELTHPETGARGRDRPRLTKTGKRMSRREVGTLVSRYGELGAGRADLHPHARCATRARRTCSTGGGLRAIQEMLGHASLSTTQKYAHVSDGALAQGLRQRTPPRAGASRRGGRPQARRTRRLG